MTIPSFEPITAEAFEQAKSVTLDPIPCLRCGRILFSRASIVRGYGPTCAWLQALEELSRDPRHPTPFRPKAVIDFVLITSDHYEIVDHRDLVIGHLKKTRSGGAWTIILWGGRVDLDRDLENAKKRVDRIIGRMRR